MDKQPMSLQLAFPTMVASQAMWLVMSAQLMIEPESTWVSWPSMVAVVSVAILSTSFVVNFIVNVQRDLKELKRQVRELKGESNESD